MNQAPLPSCFNLSRQNGKHFVSRSPRYSAVRAGAEIGWDGGVPECRSTSRRDRAEPGELDPNTDVGPGNKHTAGDLTSANHRMSVRIETTGTSGQPISLTVNTAAEQNSHLSFITTGAGAIVQIFFDPPGSFIAVGGDHVSTSGARATLRSRQKCSRVGTNFDPLRKILKNSSQNLLFE